jgi:PAS domain-containing protein
MAGPHAGETKTAWDDAPDGLALVDARGRFVQVNLAGARLFGQGRDPTSWALWRLSSWRARAVPARSGCSWTGRANR